MPETSRPPDHAADDHWDDLVARMYSLEWDALSENILGVLTRHAGAVQGKRILEAGSGTGRISQRFAQSGARVTLLDLSPDALDLSREHFAQEGVAGEFRQGSLLSMPCEAETFDMVWNAGVLEHFVPEEQVTALAEMARVTRRGGLVITLNPFSGSIGYRLGKAGIEAVTEFPYGYEVSIRTLAREAARVPSLVLLEEYSTGFLNIPIGGLAVCAMALGHPEWRKGWALRSLNGLYVELFRSPLGGALRAVDRGLSRLLGGYLLVSVFRRRD